MLSENVNNMSKPNLELNKQVVYLRDELNMTYRQISDTISMSGTPLSEKVAREKYLREKAAAQTSKEGADREQ